MYKMRFETNTKSTPKIYTICKYNSDIRYLKTKTYMFISPNLHRNIDRYKYLYK